VVWLSTEGWSCEVVVVVLCDGEAGGFCVVVVVVDWSCAIATMEMVNKKIVPKTTAIIFIGFMFLL
jgi:hypothetical protein